MSAPLLVLLSALAGAPQARAEPAPERLAPPEELAAGTTAVFKPLLLGQVWLFFDRSAPSGCSTSGCAETSTALRVRRLEIGLQGSVFDERLQYRVSIDPSRAPEFRSTTLTVTGSPEGARQTVTVRQPAGATSILNDLILTFAFAPAEISLGQFRVPVTWEGYNGSSRLLLPERSVVVREFGDRRDLGVRVSKSFAHFGYGVFLFNGSGQNTLEPTGDNQKEVAVRLEAYPLPGLTLGVASFDSVGRRGATGTRDRWGADARFERGPWLAQAEFMRARDRRETGVEHSYGFYFAGGYTLRERLQLVARYSHLDRRLGAGPEAGDEANVYEGGLNLFLSGNEAKLQLGYSLFDWSAQPAQHQAILSTQVNY